MLKITCFAGICKRDCIIHQIFLRDGQESTTHTGKTCVALPKYVSSIGQVTVEQPGKLPGVADEVPDHWRRLIGVSVDLFGRFGPFKRQA